MRMMKYEKETDMRKVNCRADFRGGVTLRALTAAALVGCLAIGAQAQPALQSETTQPQLAPVPKSDAEKAYTLTKVDAKGENTITKFEYDKTTGKITPVYYRVDLAKTVYGSGDGVRYYGWSNNVSGERVFGEVPKAQADITAKYDTANLQSHISVGYDDEKSSINGDFLTNTDTRGGAILNEGLINNIAGDFIGNIADAKGGAIYNDGGIYNINGNFIGNKAESGGAIHSAENSQIVEIKGDFIGNSASNSGGAIDVYYDNTPKSYEMRPYSIRSITGNFIGNKVDGSAFWTSGGGAISSNLKIGDIKGDFIANSVHAREEAYGGAVQNYDYIASIDSITGDFIGNYTDAGNFAYGGAVYNSGDIGTITGDFIGNSSQADYGAMGGAILNSQGNIGDIKGNFINNSVAGEEAMGGAIANSQYRFSLDGYNMQEYRINSITGDFIGNSAQGEYVAGGGALFNEDTIGSVSGNFIQNSAVANDFAYGGAVVNHGWIGMEEPDGVNGYIVVDKVTLVSPDGSQSITIYQEQVGPSSLSSVQNKKNFIDEMIEDGYKIGFINNQGSQQAPDEETWQYVLALLEEKLTLGDVVLAEDFEKYEDIMGLPTSSFKNSSFIGNSAVAKGEDGEARGGAIFTDNSLILEATDGYTSVISGNYVEDRNGKRPEAIYVNYGRLVFSAKKNGKFVIDDVINGRSNYFVGFTGDKTGKIYLNNNITAELDPQVESLLSDREQQMDTGNPGVYLDKVTLTLGRDSVLDNTNLGLNSGTFSMVNNQVGVSSPNQLVLMGDTNFVADVDLAKGEMDRFEANSYGDNTQPSRETMPDPSRHYGNLHVTGLNMLSDAPENQEMTEIYFAQIGLKDNVVNGVSQTPTDYQTKAYTPIYQYNVMYDNRNDGGYFLFTKGDKIFVPDGNGGTTVKPTPGGNASDAFNPSVLSSPVAAQAGAYAAQNAVFSYAFQHADSFMPLPSSERFAIRNANKYAINETPNFESRLNDFHDRAIWVRPYTSFESIPLKNGPKVNTITYGTLVGGDSNFKELRNGWGTVFTAYAGYNGSSQDYSGVSTYQNGGLLGATQTFYKGNFFTALTASAGASAGESHNMYGHENFNMLMAGLANKTGYNFEFKDGKYIIQPTMQLSYSFVNTFDYRNSAGVKINSDPLHAIQLNPNVRFIANLKNGWQPYASVGMVWNLLDETKVTANDVKLPEMSIKPYVEYGVGVQKRWKDKFTGFLQAMIRNGGRNGVALTAGFRWALGKEGKPIEKVQTPDATKMSSSTVSGKKILKQLTPEQRTALGAKPQDTSRTVKTGVLKQL